MNKSKEYSIPYHGLNDKQKSKADEELVKARLASLSKIGDKQKIYADLISLKFKLIEYIDFGFYSEEFIFSKFLNEYVKILKITKRQLAADLSIHETRFSRLTNNKENPGLGILYRIEEHSNKLIPASLLWRIVNMKLASEIESNIKERKKQSKFVKNKLKLKTAQTR